MRKLDLMQSLKLFLIIKYTINLYSYYQLKSFEGELNLSIKTFCKKSYAEIKTNFDFLQMGKDNTKST